MNWVDVLVVLLALVAGASGARHGLVTALFSFIGVLLGAVIGLKLAPLVLERLNDAPAKVVVGSGIVVLFVALGETFGVWAGRELRSRINAARLTGVDNVFGAVVQALATFVVAWMVALPFTAATGMPGLAAAINNSKVLRAVNALMPPVVNTLPGDLHRILGDSGFPDALAPFSGTPPAQTAPPDSALTASPIVRSVQGSVVKIRGLAPSCSRSLEGTGFVIAPHRVLTNAHVVAGTDQVAVDTGRGNLNATVVLYDPSRDVAVLSVPGLEAGALSFAQSPAQPGNDVIALGYPLDGPYTASAGRVREEINLRGPNIYDSATVQRDVYTVRAKVQSGNSGGPLIDSQGLVEGVVFGAAVDDSETGYVLTDAEVEPDITASAGLSAAVPTGECTS
jgi:S1-C subfamily serine protease